MGIRIHFHDAPPAVEVKADLERAGFKLSESQKKFLEEHDGHRGLVFDSNRVYCRTCNKRDGQ